MFFTEYPKGYAKTNAAWTISSFERSKKLNPKEVEKVIHDLLKDVLHSLKTYRYSSYSAFGYYGKFELIEYEYEIKIYFKEQKNAFEIFSNIYVKHGDEWCTLCWFLLEKYHEWQKNNMIQCTNSIEMVLDNVLIDYLKSKTSDDVFEMFKVVLNKTDEILEKIIKTPIE